MDEFTNQAGPNFTEDPADPADDLAAIAVPLADAIPPVSPGDPADETDPRPGEAEGGNAPTPIEAGADDADDPDSSEAGAAAQMAEAPPPPPPADANRAESAGTEAVPASISAEAPSTADVVPARRFRLGRTVALVVAALLLLGVIGAAGIAYATYDYSRDFDGRILPGATVAGVDVGGMTRAEAMEAVKAAVRPELTREVTLTWRDKSWTTTPKELGAKSDARVAVDAALAASGDTTFFDKARMRVLGDSLEFDRGVAVRYPRKGTKGFIAGIASSFDRDARDASLDYSSGWVEIEKDRRGRKVKVPASVAALTEALETGADEAELDVRVVEPEVTTDAFRQVLLVHIGDNKLYLYEDGEIVREYTVATGEPNYMTPSGVFEVTEKRYLPTWVNPAPDGWGADMPASIPPGPGNPLGLRAINWSAPAIRFHGTSATYSLGYNASHGCVRLSNADVIELYDRIEVGVPIVSIVHGSLRPLGSSAPRSGPTAEQSADSAADAAAAETTSGRSPRKNNAG